MKHGLDALDVGLRLRLIRPTQPRNCVNRTPMRDGAHHSGRRGAARRDRGRRTRHPGGRPGAGVRALRPARGVAQPRHRRHGARPCHRANHRARSRRRHPAGEPLQVQAARSSILRTLALASEPLRTTALPGRAGSSEHFVHAPCDDWCIALLQAERPHDHTPVMHERGIDVNRGRAVLEGNDEIECREPMRAGSDIEHETGLRPVRAFLDADPACVFGLELSFYVLQASEASLIALPDVLPDEKPERDEQGHDLLLADLAGAADPVLGQTAEIQAGEQRGRRAPLLEEEIVPAFPTISRGAFLFTSRIAYSRPAGSCRLWSGGIDRNLAAVIHTSV